MYDPYTIAYRQTNKLINDLEKAINGEFTAVQCYSQLVQMAPTDMERRRIMEIRKDEKRHLRQFSTIYKMLTGKDAAPQLKEGCPNVYVNGLHFAFVDEQETVDFYLDIAENTSDSYIKETFKRASADEQNHAVWFLHFLTMKR
ncbi:ferritin-like domain-containing protein [Neobacillus sp. D3-1R]|uniref:ferritin-like domain-containing protein n=1 Tax=Neobacillus sp. D3-1R TaxID=3445778 RepID=UPI003FA01EFC